MLSSLDRYVSTLCVHAHPGKSSDSLARARPAVVRAVIPAARASDAAVSVRREGVACSRPIAPRETDLTADEQKAVKVPP